MDKDFIRFLNREINVFNLGNGFTLGREKAINSDYMIINYEGEKLFEWFESKKDKTNENPKHTGGKPSYIKIMLEEVRKHTELSLSASGFFLKVSDNIQWSTNLLIDKRSKKALSVDSIGKVLNINKTKTYEIIKELNSAQLLSKDKDGYKISSYLIQKGGAKR